MNDNDRRRWNMLVAVDQFGVDNAPDFTTGIGHTHFNLVHDLVGDTQLAAAAQLGSIGELSEKVVTKGSAREDLREQMSAIAHTARSMAYAFPGIANEFRFPPKLSDADFLAKGRSFYTASADNEADFIAYGLDVSFRDDLNDACNAFEASFSAAAGAKTDKVAATADISESIRKGMISARTLDGPVRNKYAGNPAKLAAWHSASHVEAAPKKKNGGPVPVGGGPGPVEEPPTP
jgi:hypothetical protein